MATIGTLGDIVFSVSPKVIRTFNGLKKSVSPKFSSHNRHLKETLLEFTGTDPDKISFSMTLSVFLGVDPQAEAAKLESAARTGRIMRLILGRQSYGKWVITSLSNSYERIDNKGNVLIIKTDISLTAYAGR